MREAISTATQALLKVGKERGLFLSDGKDCEGDKNDDSLKGILMSYAFSKLGEFKTQGLTTDSVHAV